MKPRDVLPDDVEISRPPLVEHRGIGPEADRRRVVDQGIEPDVDHAAGIEWERNAPGLSRPAHGDVLEAALEQAQNLVAPDVGPQKARVGGEMVEKPLAVSRQAEEVVLLANPLRLRLMQGTGAVDEIAFLLELLAADTVPALVHTFEDVAG